MRVKHELSARGFLFMGNRVVPRIMTPSLLGMGSFLYLYDEILNKKDP